MRELQSAVGVGDGFFVVVVGVGVGVGVATQLLQTADSTHGSRGIKQIVVVDIETQELPDLVEIGMIVVMGGVDENVSVGNGGKEDEVVGEGVEEGNVVEEIDDEVPVFPAVDDVWLAVLELPEPDTKVNVTVGAVN